MRLPLSFRRRLALLICPEFMGVQQVVGIDASPLPISGETEHVIRLGRLLMAAHGASSFSMALGVPRGKPRKGSEPRAAWQIEVCWREMDWRAFVKRPPVRVGAKVYGRFLQFFSDHWPADLEWPRDIARPAASLRRAA